jgi:hypothetical protein
MARVLRMPTMAELPEGAVRDFVAFLWFLHRAANRPTLRVISKSVESIDHMGTASTETIRRMLRGDSVPANWLTAEAVFEALCHLAGHDPDSDGWRFLRVEGTARTLMKRFWNEALDEPVASTAPSSEPIWSFTDEPPF